MYVGWGLHLKTSLKKIFRLPLLAVFLLAFSAASFAKEPPRHPVLHLFEAKGGKVDFLGHAHGLDGWIVINPQGAAQYIYTTPDGAFLEGMLFDPGGMSVTVKQLKSYRQKISGSQEALPESEQLSAQKDEKLYAEAEKARWIPVGGDKAPYLYIFMNVTCSHCQELWKDLDSFVADGKIQVRLIPYGATEQNRDAAAALLSAENPAEAWRAYIAGNKEILAKDKIKGDAYLKVDANTAIVNNWKLPGVPFTLYRRPSDGIISAVVGKPENTMLLVAELQNVEKGKKP